MEAGLRRVRMAVRETPPCTGVIAGLSVLLPVLVGLRIVHPYWVVLLRDEVFKKLQLWRLVTCVFVKKPSIGLVFSVINRYSFSDSVERTILKRREDYAKFFLYCCLVMGVFGLFGRESVMWNGFDMALVYLWSRYNQTTPTKFLVILPVPGKYLPWSRLAFDLLLGESVVPHVLGIIAGHSFFYLYTQTGLFQKKRIGRGRRPVYKDSGAGYTTRESVQKDAAFLGVGKNVGGGSK
ncbi:MAG: Der1-like protein [Amphiamblys sp. WSBS2006]|nr:MAG: Der1-like protein [Amphiamblys sp. WSBS2006]